MKRKYKLQPVLIRSYNRIIPTDYFLVDLRSCGIYIYIYISSNNVKSLEFHSELLESIGSIFLYAS